MDEQQVYPDSLARIQTLVRDTFEDIFLAYYEDDPIIIPKNNFPCIITEKVAGNVSQKGARTGSDLISEKIMIRLVMDKRDDIGKSDDYDMTKRRLRRLVEARDPTTGYFQPDTLMYVLRTNISLGSTIIDQDIDINYDLQPRPERQVTAEAIITIVTRQQVTIPNRV
jgi:hypothetical protein